jgi:hypothetical protein
VVMVDSDLLHELDDTSLEHRVLDPHEGLGEVRRTWREIRSHRQATAPFRSPGVYPVRSARLQKRTPPGLAGCGRFAAIGSRRCGSCPSSISGPVETSGQVRCRDSSGSLPASSGARAPGCRRVGRRDLGPYCGRYSLSFQIEKSAHVLTGTNAGPSKRCERSEGLLGVMIATYLQRLNEVSHV